VPKFKILALIMAAVFLTSCSSNSTYGKVPVDGALDSKVVAVNTTPSEITEDGYMLAASNENYSLYYEETGLTVKVKNNHTGAVMTSAAPPKEDSGETWKNFVNSGIVLEYYKGKAVNINKINMYSGKPQKKISLIKNGFAAELNFKSIGIQLTMFVTLDDASIRVQVPNSSIKETNENCRLAAIYVLPFLGYTHLGEVEGYMLIPDGCGALIDLKDNNEKFSQPFKSKIYGGNYSVEADTTSVQKFDESIATTADTVEVFAPVFGMVHKSSQNAFLGIIESGKYNAEIYAYPNGVITEFNWISARYIYREPYKYLTGQSGSIISAQEKRETFDISVVYRFAGGEDADYVGLAKCYREYLKENGVLKADNNIDYSMRLDFFAGDVEESLFGTSFVPMTSVSQIDEILSNLASKDVKQLSVSLKGWQDDGIYGEINGDTSFESDVGDFDEYVDLAKKYKNIDFMLYADFLNTYSKSGSKDYIYQYNGSVFSSETFLELHPTKYRYTADASKQRISDFVKELKTNGKIGVLFDGVTDEVYSYEIGERTEMNTRQFAAGIINKALLDAGKKLKTAYIAPNDYLWAETQRYYDYKIYGSDYKFVTNEVPFFAIVLNGSLPLYSEYVNFKADTTEYKLKLIESGIYPSFLLTAEAPSALIYTDSASLFSCEYAEYSEMIAEYDRIFKSLSKSTNSSAISNHSSNNGVSVTEYENGTMVIVNYNDYDVEYNGETVEKQSWKILEGKAVK